MIRKITRLIFVLSLAALLVSYIGVEQAMWLESYVAAPLRNVYSAIFDRFSVPVFEILLLVCTGYVRVLLSMQISIFFLNIHLPKRIFGFQLCSSVFSVCSNVCIFVQIPPLYCLCGYFLLP